MIHQLKIKPEYFKDIIEGRKSFEVRQNDRNFHIGDILGLNEIAPNGIETGKCTFAEIIYILENKEFLQEGFVVLGIEAFPQCDRNANRITNHFKNIYIENGYLISERRTGNDKRC